MHRRILAGCTCLLLLVGGCASDPKVAAITHKLEKVSNSSKSVSVPDPLSYKFIGQLGGEAEIHLLPGAYQLTWKNDAGSFYSGVRYSVWWKQRSDFVLAPGGLWIPHDSAEPPRFFWYMAGSTVIGNSLEEVLSKSPKPASLDPVTGVVINTILYSPTPISPVAGAVGGGIAMGLIHGMISDTDLIFVYGEPLPESVPSLRAGIVYGP